ncbi:hypothetical protein AAC387_Pa02g4429 [Persea americana]
MSQQAPKFELQKWWKRVVMRERNAYGFFNPTGSGRDSLPLPYFNPAVKREPCRNAGQLSLVSKFLRAPWRLASSRPDFCFVLVFLILYTSGFFFFKTGERSIVTAEEKLMLAKLELGHV